MLRPLHALLPWSLAALAATAGAADIGLQPTTIQFDARTQRGTVQVHNRGNEPVTLQADGQGWVRQDGQDVESPQHRLMINPPLFTVAPGATQLVRVGLRGGADDERETLYRLVLRELPPAPSAGPSLVSGQVRVLVALRLPVYVAPRNVRRDSQWAIERADDGRYVARVTNTGNVHLRLAGLRVQDSAASTTWAEHGPMAPLFPGETRRLALRADTPLPDRPLRMELRTADEVRHVDVALASR